MRLFMATAMLQESLPVEEIQGRILECVREGLGADHGMLFLHDEQMFCLHTAGEPVITVPITSDPHEPLSATLRSLAPQRVESAAGASEHLRLPEALRDAVGTGGFVTVPLVAHGRPMGVLLLHGHDGQLPPADRLPMLAAFGMQAGLALERARADEQLRRSEYEVDRRLRALSDAIQYSADAILSVDADGMITSWNLGAESMFGYASGEFVGRPYETLVPPDLMDEFRNVVRARVDPEGHLQGFQTEWLHRDGRRIPVSVTVTKLGRNTMPPMGYSVVVRDITERRREEQRQRLLSSITEQSPDAILSLDRVGRITSWNRGAERMFGYRDEEIVGSQWVLLAPAERESEFHAVVDADTAGGDGEVTRTADTLARTRDGRPISVRLFASVLRGTDGEPVGWSVILRDLTEQRTLAEMSERLQVELLSRNRLEGIVGNSGAMDDVRDRIRRVARFNSSVLLLGQSGTGKEIVANAIHYNSPRCEKPVVKVNCAAIPEHLLESELFGIERNVATGVDGRIGRFELADGGTLFLDEVGDMSLSTQARILRVLQEREFERVGGKKVIKVDVRIIAATNKDLEAEIQGRRFREDLYYRLNVIVISLPPLCMRREDIDPLIDHFLERFTRDNGLPRKRLSLPARLTLNEYDWPGNVRELEHCIERAVVMSEGTEIADADLPPGIQIWKEMEAGPGPGGAKGSLSQILRQVERRAVLDALERSGGVQARAARLLGISERSMWYRVKKLGLHNQAS
ncbi:MAG: sigma 54-interacting transcriptional regulator [Candidatus Polarisedimenticolia bacterium]